MVIFTFLQNEFAKRLINQCVRLCRKGWPQENFSAIPRRLPHRRGLLPPPASPHCAASAAPCGLRAAAYIRSGR